ncbi:envelope penetration protein [Enterobacteria phage PRDcanary]
MEKVKAWLIKYKWWIVAAIGGVAAFLLLKNRGGSSGSSEMYMTGAGPVYQQAGSGAVDNTMALASLQAQTQLAGQNAALQAQLDASRLQLETQLNIETLAADNAHYATQSQLQLGMAQVDLSKYLGDLQSATSTALAGMQSDTAKYQSNIQLQAENIRANTSLAEINAQKYIVGKQADIAMYQAQTERRGQDYGFAMGLLNFGSKFF